MKNISYFGRAKHVKVSVILFKRFRTFFAQKVKPKSFFSKMKKDFTIEIFHIQLNKHKILPKMRRLDCGFLADFSEILKTISKSIFGLESLELQ